MSMSKRAEQIVADSLVLNHEWTQDEIRRQTVLHSGAPYIGYYEGMPIHEALEKLHAIERWLISGELPPKPSKPDDPKSKFRIVSDEAK